MASGRGSVVFAQNWLRALLPIVVAAFLLAVPFVEQISADNSFAAEPPAADIDTCAGGVLTPAKMPPIGAVKDLEVTGDCEVPAGNYYYGNVNIYVKNSGVGNLSFDDATTNFWANSILVENGGTLRAGISKDGATITPIGTNGVLTIHLYGAEDKDPRHGVGILCKEGSMCGVDPTTWKSNIGNTDTKKCTVTKKLPGGVDDCFYAYKSLNFDDGDTNAYFGYKVLAVSFGGSLRLFGKKGASYDTITNNDPSNSGTSWVRLAANLQGGGKDTSITLDRAVDWKDGDQIVIMSTDYMPGHAELLTLDGDANGNTIKVKAPGVQYAHQGMRFPLLSRDPKIPDRLGLDPNLVTNGIENRAAVGLLSRSIKIVSGGNGPNVDFPGLPSTYSFGGHTIVRQGFRNYQVQGVEFSQLGEGGKIGHYPVHFHLARKTARTDPTQNAFVKDCSIWDSMTRWIVIHGTQDITLARNVGYESIGHGYYLEDASEINNKLYSNLGILARAAVDNVQNPRKVPGILAADFPPVNGIAPERRIRQEFVPYHSDIDHPSVFWMTNGWNDFEYNVASGAGTCGVCYWLVPAWNSGPSSKMAWQSYAAEQRESDRVATSPLQKFLGNSCSSAMTSFQTIGDSSACLGVVNNDDPQNLFPVMPSLHNDFAKQLPKSRTDKDFDLTKAEIADLATYYPNVSAGGGRFATKCPDVDPTKPFDPKTDCGDRITVKACSQSDESNCMPTVLDHYTSSFNWAHFNLAAIWLRPQWSLVINSAITDVQGGGLSFVTGGGYTHSDEIPGYWGLALKNIFVGATQPSNPYAFAGGPFNPKTAAMMPPFKISCAAQTNNGFVGNYCLDTDQGVSFPITSFGGNQRFFNIYDGPSYQDSNAYLDIKKTTGLDCTSGPGGCFGSQWPNARGLGTPQDNTISGTDNCYLPNAAIAWKQPNGFYYPPAFHSKNLFFDNVDIRHFVIEPLFKPGTFDTDDSAVTTHYCTGAPGMFIDFTDVDRQTELDDDDGSLTGLAQTISVNLDPFFTAPVETVECQSGPFLEKPAAPTLPPGTAKTSPYEYVTTAIYPKCFASDPGSDKCNKILEGSDPPTIDPTTIWRKECSNSVCYGVPLYRQYLTNQEKNGPPMPAALPTPSIKMMGQDQAQRSSLTVNNATYYIDTTMTAADQVAAPRAIASNVFRKNQTYYLYLLFAKPNTKQTYQLYVGQDPDWKPDANVQLVRAEFPDFPYHFKKGTWPAQWNRDGYDPGTGIETITIDMNGYADFLTDFNKSKVNECAPVSYCAPTGTNNACTCQLAKDPKNPQQFIDCQSVCTNWANKDVECPNGQCFGFAVTLSDKFEPIPKAQPRPQPTPGCFPNNIFNIPVTPASDDLAGTCANPLLPITQLCN